MHAGDSVFVDSQTRDRVDERLEELYRRHLGLGEAGGEVARYYSSELGYYQPERGADESERFSVCLVTVDGDVHTAGDHNLPFALQSLSKVFVYGMALEEHGRKEVLRRVGVKPSADAFTTLGFDEANNRPYNPMLNGGALATTDMMLGPSFDDSFERILETLRLYAGNDSLAADEDTFRAECRGADRNRATAYLMRSNGMLAGDVDETLRLYLRQCSVHVTCRDLAVMAATLANGCACPVTGERALARDRVRDVLSVMYTCGMYDFAGEWAYEIGVPAKSGVSGGIMAVVPGKMGIGVFSPGLDRYGNSVRGVRVCSEIAERLGLHVFATEAEDALLGQAQPA
jgi:glutaminase